MSFLDYNRTVVGYHGTSLAQALDIVRTQRFRPSRNNHDWLGHGIYFWEHAPKQARWWARRRYGDGAAVVASMIRLGNCLDLLDPDNARLLSEHHDVLEQTAAARGETLRKNYNTKKYRDCLVLESYYANVHQQGEPEIKTSRGVYVPTSGGMQEGSGYRLWERSWLTFDAHIQICVRNSSCIVGTWPVNVE